MRKTLLLVSMLAGLMVSIVAYAQFSSTLEGTVQDPSGAAIPKADVKLTNLGTQVTQTTTTDAGGNYRFVSLAPAQYQVIVTAKGFTGSSVELNLLTAQVLNLPVTLAISTTKQAITVSGTPPALDTGDSRSEMTVGQVALTTLPLPGRSLINLVAMAPGVEGTGVAGFSGIGSAVDNYAIEQQMDASANGRSSIANMFVVDGLDITSNVRPGVLNVVPNPDSIQESSVQTNTFSVEYGRASSIQMIMTTKSGTDQFHGNASDYFTYQSLWAGTEFTHSYKPFHSNNMSGTIGGPISRSRHAYFFFSIEPLRSSTSFGNTATYEDPQFVTWANQNFPNNLGAQLMEQYPPTHATTTAVSKTATNIFPGTCATSATANIPCSLPMIDTGIFNGTNYRNGLQYNIRGDKTFSKDRVYFNYYGTTLDTDASNVRLDMTTTSNYFLHSMQFDETHTFSPTTLNEATLGYYHIVGDNPATGTFKVPVLSVTGQSSGIGDGSAQELYWQHNFRWRDVVTHIRGTHILKFGYDGWNGNDVGYFQSVYSQPSFAFTNLLNLAEDNPHSEANLAYNPLTGGPGPGNSGYGSESTGVFAQDTWKTTRNLTLTFGLRFDYNGNPHNVFYPLASFILGPGQTYNQQVANGIMAPTPNAFNHAPMGWSPRIGVAWAPGHSGKWVVRGGYGVYHDWLTLANSLKNQIANPPAYVTPTFLTGTTTPPVFAEGTSNTYPFGFTYPTLPAYGINAQGGLVGDQISVGGVNPNLKLPLTNNYTISLERQLGKNLVASVAYSGSHSTGLLIGSSALTSTSYGQDINRFSGDLIVNKDKLTRLNPSFGVIQYDDNGSTATYNALIVNLKGRLGSRGFVNASYTRSSSHDDVGVGPTTSFTQTWGPSTWDAPNRFSLAESYTVPALKNMNRFLENVTGGWELTSTTILQCGLPYTVYTNAAFQPLYDANGNVIGMAAGSGDYNADGHDYDLPNIPSSGYTTPTSRNAYLSGVFTASAFGIPQLGTEGNELFNRFRGPGLAETDFALLKEQRITERTKLQIRFEFYNIFNRPNLTQVDSNLPDATFGKSTGQDLPRWVQFGLNLMF